MKASTSKSEPANSSKDAELEALRAAIPYRARIAIVCDDAPMDKAALSERVREIIPAEIIDLYDDNSRRLISSSPNTPMAFSALTTLAAEADHFVALEILKNPGSTLEVVLPCAKDDLLREIHSAASRQQFNELLGKARRPVALINRPLSEEFPEMNREAARLQACADASRYAVDRSDVLLALKDPKQTAEMSHAHKAIEYARAKKRPVIIVSTDASLTVERGHGLSAQAISGIQMFNTYSIPEAQGRQYMENMHGSIFSGDEGAVLPEEAKRLVREELLPFYVRASSVAKMYQKTYLRAGLLVYCFSTSAVAAVALGTLIHALSPWAFATELILLVLILLLVWFADRRRAHRKWIESRFLAERIRSAIFLCACDVEPSPIQVLPHMSIAHRPDDWMVLVFNEICGRLPSMKGCKGQSCALATAFVRKAWIQDQIRFHEKKAEKSEQMSRRLEWTGKAIFAVALAAAVFHLVLFFIGDESHAAWLEKSLTFIALVLPAAGAAIEGIRTHREYSRLAKRSAQMAVVLRELDERFASVSKPEELEMALREADELMLRETQDWLMLMRFIVLEPVV